MHSMHTKCSITLCFMHLAIQIGVRLIESRLFKMNARFNWNGWEHRNYCINFICKNRPLRTSMPFRRAVHIKYTNNIVYIRTDRVPKPNICICVPKYARLMPNQLRITKLSLVCLFVCPHDCESHCFCLLLIYTTTPSWLASILSQLNESTFYIFNTRFNRLNFRIFFVFFLFFFLFFFSSKAGQ